MKFLEYVDTIFKEEDFNWITDYRWFKNYVGELKHTTYNIKPSRGWKGYNDMEIKIHINSLFDYVIGLSTYEVGEYKKEKSVSVHFSNHFNWKMNPSDISEMDHFYGYYCENAMKFLGCGKKYCSLDTLKINENTAEKFIQFVERFDSLVPTINSRLSWLNTSLKPWEISSGVHEFFDSEIMSLVAGKI